jgi:hypothetical protein
LIHVCNMACAIACLPLTDVTAGAKLHSKLPGPDLQAVM